MTSSDRYTVVRGSRAWTAVPVFCALVACSGKGGGGDDGDCRGPTCAANASPIDWQASAPVFTAQLRVLDVTGAVVPNATVRHGTRQTNTDAAGRASIGLLDATRAVSVRVDRPGLTRQVVTVSAATAAMERQTVTLAPLTLSKDLETGTRNVLSGAGARVEISEQSLASEDGTRPRRVHVDMTYLPPGAGASLAPSGDTALDQEGAPAMMARNLGSLFVRFTAADGAPLNLAIGATAMVELPIGADARLKDGDMLPLWALDELAGTWKKERTCRVQTRTVGAKAEQSCLGVVDHFSWWRVGEEVKVYEPNTVGCLYGTVHFTDPTPCYTFRHISLRALRCDSEGKNCVDAGEASRLSLGYADSRYCGLVSIDDTGATYRLLARYLVATDGCGTGAPKPGWRAKLSEPTTLQSFKDLLGTKVMLNFTLSPGRDCAKACTPLTVPIGFTDLQDPRWTDRDDDGWFTTTDADVIAVQHGYPRDCDDQRADINPSAPEPFCVTEDRNCDGTAWPAFASLADVPAGIWNASCKACRELPGVSLPLGEEVPLNDYDEDCDGTVSDRDGDTFSEPSDCNDANTMINPGLPEIVGNYADENCDGIALDADGDGYFDPKHKIATTLPASIDKNRFTDCDDLDPVFHPEADPSREAGALRSFYYDAEGVIRRVPWFCNLFDAKGNKTDFYRAAVRDLNCDGVVLDVDGDGVAAPLDCDDLDPRTLPVGSGANAQCTVLASLPNDSVCNLVSRDTAEGCPVLSFSGTDVVTRCEELKNADGTVTGTAGCSFPGWWQGNPLVFTPSASWGPCDGEGGLPDCPQGDRCGGPLPYTAALLDYLKSTYLGGQELRFAGMCFPGCNLSSNAPSN